MTRRGICIFGEVLFDHFPDGTRVLGGAPFNVAWHLQAFGQSPHFISRVGNDSAGEAIRDAMHKWAMDTHGLQTDPERPTGRVEVSFVDGEPQYDIVHPCAYDAIEADAVGTDCDLLYHGSLGLRDARSRNALAQLLTCSPKTVFVDVNLRPPWWQKEQVLKLLNTAQWVKLNAHELDQLHAAGIDTARRARDFLRQYDLQGLLLTHGAQGAELFTASGENFGVKPNRDIPVSDTVGAGDAFASVMILGLVNDWPTRLTLQRAQDFASAIVGNRGATVSDPAFYQSFIKRWTSEA
ncbi:MAG: carbohydrate kinase [Gammaproteobacteria bacterium]|nr:carbohydrate kinase [Gammaproteobacteria bacterium]